MEEKTPSRNKSGWFCLIFFIAGLVAGSVITLGTGVVGSLYRSFHQLAAIQMGRLLDTDFIYLRSGDILHGCILSEDEKSIWIEFPKGSAKIDRSDILRLEKNPYTRYVRGLW